MMEEIVLRILGCKPGKGRLYVDFDDGEGEHEAKFWKALFEDVDEEGNLKRTV